MAARRAARGGPGRRRRGAEVGLPDNTLCPIFSTSTPFQLPDNAFCPIFSTSSSGGTGPEGRVRLPASGLGGRAAAAMRAGWAVRPGARLRRIRAARLRRRLRGASRAGAALVKTPVHWRVESRKTLLRGQKRLSLEENPADRPRFSGGGASAPVAPAAKPQFRRPYQEAWSKLALSVPTVKAGFDHGGCRPARAARGAAPRADVVRRAPAGRGCVQPEASRTKPAPIAARQGHPQPACPPRAPQGPDWRTAAICGGFVRRTRRS